MNRTGFETLRVYHLAEEIADLVWDVVMNNIPRLREQIEDILKDFGNDP